MSILPAEAFFSDGIFLVEGPSEMLFYHSLANALNIDLDFENLSILSVDGISFKVFISILNALQIPWIMRTDNDISKVPKKHEWNYAGMNRCLKIAELPELTTKNAEFTAQDTVHEGLWQRLSTDLNKKGIFLSKIDLETDLVNELSIEVIKEFGYESKNDAIKYLQGKKALRMSSLLKLISKSLNTLAGADLARPLYELKKLNQGNN